MACEVVERHVKIAQPTKKRVALDLTQDIESHFFSKTSKHADDVIHSLNI